MTSLHATREQARSKAAEFKTQSSAYFAKWDETLKGMSEDTASAGRQRMALAKESIDRLQKQADAIRAELNPFMSSLNEATKYLATDTTKAGAATL